MDSTQSSSDSTEPVFTDNKDLTIASPVVMDTQSPSVFTFPSRPPAGTGPSFHNWMEVYPELSIFLEKDNFADVVAEAKSVARWTPWPESHFSSTGAIDWTVFPFLHTFPAVDLTKKTYVESTCEYCPKTTALLKRIPNIRTALFSRLGYGTKLNPHTGWEDLANHVLRCHVSLMVPTGQCCGLWVDGEEQYHAEGNILVFDDSKKHLAFNRKARVCNDSGMEEDEDGSNSLACLSVEEQTEIETDRDKTDRIVLIIDIMRPDYMPLGNVEGGHTPELDEFISQFR